MRKKGPGAAEAHPTINIFPSTDALLCAAFCLGKEETEGRVCILRISPFSSTKWQIVRWCVLYYLFNPLLF